MFISSEKLAFSLTTWSLTRYYVSCTRRVVTVPTPAVKIPRRNRNVRGIRIEHLCCSSYHRNNNNNGQNLLAPHSPSFPCLRYNTMYTIHIRVSRPAGISCRGRVPHTDTRRIAHIPRTLRVHQCQPVLLFVVAPITTTVHAAVGSVVERQPRSRLECPPITSLYSARRAYGEVKEKGFRARAVIF